MGWMSLRASTDQLWFPTRDGGVMLFDGRTAVTYISDTAMTKPKLRFRDAMVAKLGKEPQWPFLSNRLHRREEAMERMRRRCGSRAASAQGPSSLLTYVRHIPDKGEGTLAHVNQGYTTMASAVSFEAFDLDLDIRMYAAQLAAPFSARR